MINFLKHLFISLLISFVLITAIMLVTQDNQTLSAIGFLAWIGLSLVYPIRAYRKRNTDQPKKLSKRQERKRQDERDARKAEFRAQKEQEETRVYDVGVEVDGQTYNAPLSITIKSSGGQRSSEQTLWKGSKKAEICYTDAAGERSTREVRITRVWSNEYGEIYYGGHCYLADDYRMFKADRTRSATCDGESFSDFSGFLYRKLGV